MTIDKILNSIDAEIARLKQVRALLSGGGTMKTASVDVFDDSYLAPSYYVAPQSFQPVVRPDSQTGGRELTVMRWGLVPF